jgi:CRP-like cAMP-binding protein
MKVTSSALMLRLEQLTTLNPDERQALHHLERDSRSVKKRETVLRRGTVHDTFAILRSGWATRRVTGTDGRSAITHVFCPGDLIGFCDLGTKATPHNVIMQTDGSVSRFESADLSRLAKEHPRLLSVLTCVSQVENMVLRDRFFAATRLSAEDRLMHFLLCIQSKVPNQGEKCADRFQVPLSQKEIGDALGLTDIYVNRLLRSLADRDEISVERPYMRIRDPRQWIEHVGFQDRYQETDIAWLA